MRAKGVHVGRDGWLFWTGADGQFPPLWRDGLLSRLRLLRWRRRLARRAARARALGADFVQLFAPDKFTLYGERADLPGLDPRMSFARRIAVASPHALDLVAPLEALRDGGVDAVLRTDSHWTPAGFLAAYRALCARLRVAPAAHVLAGPDAPQTHDLLFDLGAKLSPPVREAYTPHDFPRAAVRREANAVARWNEADAGAQGEGLHLGRREVWINASPGVDPRRVVLFGDSYSFAPWTLGAMLAETVAETHLLWSPRIDWTYAARARPDVVVCETAERWIRELGPDDVDIDAFAEARVAAMRAAQPSPEAASAST